MSLFKLGETAGHHFRGQGDLVVAHHVTCGKRHGFFLCRKWLYDPAAFNYDPRLGWACEHWFEWPDEKKAEVSE